MTNYNGTSMEEQIYNSLEQNKKEIQEIKEDIKKIKHYIFLGKILNLIYLIIIIAPIIIAIFFLPKIIQSFTQNYLNNIAPDTLPSNLNLKNILDSYQNVIK